MEMKAPLVILSHVGEDKSKKLVQPLVDRVPVPVAVKSAVKAMLTARKIVVLSADVSNECFVLHTQHGDVRDSQADKATAKIGALTVKAVFEHKAAKKIFQHGMKWSLKRMLIAEMPELGWSVDIEVFTCPCKVLAKFEYCAHVVTGC